MCLLLLKSTLALPNTEFWYPSSVLRDPHVLQTLISALQQQRASAQQQQQQQPDSAGDLERQDAANANHLAEASSAPDAAAQVL